MSPQERVLFYFLFSNQGNIFLRTVKLVLCCRMWGYNFLNQSITVTFKTLHLIFNTHADCKSIKEFIFSIIT